MENEYQLNLLQKVVTSLKHQMLIGDIRWKGKDIN
jgi:hypothetical protein